jgi:hypothetical protein
MGMPGQQSSSWRPCGAATTNLGNCPGKVAAQFDDGISDAQTVGLAIEPVCATQFSQLMGVDGRSLNPAAHNLYIERAKPDQLQFAVDMVLTVRALRGARFQQR